MSGLGAVTAAVIAFIVTALLGTAVIPMLKRLKFGQSIRDVGPVWHKNKQGTPTMGGFMFIIGILVAIGGFLLVAAATNTLSDISKQEAARLTGGVFMALAFGFIGFMDDYIKVVKKRNLGLNVSQKLVLQFTVAALYLLIEYISGRQGTMFVVPFFNWQWQLGIFYWPLSLILIVGIVNAVNLTDGVDGLCASVTFVAALGLMLCSRLAGLEGHAALAAALAGGCLGFLVWNLHPAKVFMGDTGSLFLGGMLCAIAFGIDYPLLLLPVGILYLIEMFSVIIQVISFKTTGKRVFKMSPIHHHFELSGWSEMKIVAIFSLVTLAFTAASVIWMAFTYSSM
ncbi:MAG: phospho-N-acetylmuramoyl-pentapeptide-transferase [Clostridia bacterium]|nr:phospho-N-acetylmuramoyl-pentapeptide-transferase [Clostridia bacterium]